MIVVGVMAIVALGLLEAASIAVLVGSRSRARTRRSSNGLMKRTYTAGITGIMQITTFVIMTKLGSS